MRRLMHLAAWLYPRRWRNRYETELHALLDEVPPGWRFFADVVWGGLMMRVRMTDPAVLAAAFGTVGAVLGGVAAFAAPAQYESRGRMTVTAVGATQAADVDRAVPAVLERAAQAAFGAGSVPRAHIAVTRTAVPSEIQVAYADPDPRRAREMTERLMTRAIEANLVGVPTGGSSPAMLMRITTPPDLPQSPSRPLLVWFVVGGFVAGGLIGTAIVAGRRRALGPGV